MLELVESSGKEIFGVGKLTDLLPCQPTSISAEGGAGDIVYDAVVVMDLQVFGVQCGGFVAGGDGGAVAVMVAVVVVVVVVVLLLLLLSHRPYRPELLELGGVQPH